MGADGDRVDAVVVGAGPSGGVVAKHLAENGLSVVALEQGEMPDAARFTGRRDEWELASQKQWHPNPNVREREADYPIDAAESDINPLMFAGVGGSATLYAGHWAPFLPSDFRLRSLDGIADDWPFTYEDLLPDLVEVERDVGVSGTRGNPAYPLRDEDFPMPQLPIGKVGMKAIAGLDKLGWHWWPGTMAIASEPYRGLNACVRRGTCMTGCPEGAKSTTNLTHWPEAIRHGARLITGARVAEIEVDGDGLADAVVYVDRGGTRHRQRAGVVVLCANGIGTPRLLLASRSGRFPNGLANGSDQVGRNLMMHPYAGVQAVFDESIESWRGPFGLSVECYQFYETDRSRGFLRGAKWNLMPSGGPMSTAGFVGSKAFAGEEARLEDTWGAAHHETVARRFGRTMIIGIQGEDLPEESNRVTLSAELTDSDEIPAPKIDYRVSENSHRLLQFNTDRAVELAEACGAVEITAMPQMRDTGWHILGTAKMGAAPETSVCNADGAAHEVPNLYVMDASAFPTSAAVNPTATLMAVALRQSKRLLARRREQRSPS